MSVQFTNNTYRVRVSIVHSMFSASNHAGFDFSFLYMYIHWYRGLPRFHLDFGYVVYGMVASRTFHLTNVGHIPVSFTTPHKLLRGSGFSVDLGEKVKALPPDETLDFTVTFDPAAIKCSNGKRLIEVFFNVSFCACVCHLYMRVPVYPAYNQ